MSYSRRILSLAEKYNQFFNDKTKGQILGVIAPWTFPIDYSPLGLPDRGGYDGWDYETEYREFLEWNVRRLEYFIKYTGDLDSDYVPATDINIGYGLQSAFFTGQKVKMGKETSWTTPFLDSWDKLGELRLDRDRYWYRKILEGYGHLNDLCSGNFALSSFPHAGPADLANAVRGDELFYDLYDYPEKVHALMEKCTEAVLQLENDIDALITPVSVESGAGQDVRGQVTANTWIPGRALYLSEDFNDLCSKEQYAEFGRVYTQKVINYLGGAFIHHHSKGRHIHPLVAKLEKLKLLEISWDPNCPRPIDNLPGLLEEHGDLPLMVRCTATDVYDKIEEIKKGRVILQLQIESLSEGREVMRFIRKNSKIG
jgi:hypothetical protein